MTAKRTKRAHNTFSIGITLGLMAVWAELPLNATGLAGLVFMGMNEYDVGLAIACVKMKRKGQLTGQAIIEK